MFSKLDVINYNYIPTIDEPRKILGKNGRRMGNLAVFF
jgi:hypothetical protein